MIPIIFAALIFGGFLKLLYFYIPDGIDNLIVTFCCGGMLTLLLISISRKRSPFGIQTIFRPDSGFIFFFYILFAHPYVSYLLGWSDLSTNKFISDVFLEHSNRALVASLVGLIFFAIGYHFYENKKYSVDISLTPEVDIKIGKLARKIFLVGFFLSFALFLGTGAWVQLVTQYTGLATGDSTSDGVYFLLTFFSMAMLSSTLSLIIVLRRINAIDIFVVILSLVWAVLLLITGDRNSFLLIALIVPIVYSTFLRKVHIHAWILAAFLGFTVYQAVEISRSAGNRDFSSFIDALFDSDASQSSSGDNLSESSFSLTTITARAAFEGNESADSLYYGKFKLIGFMGVVPYSRSLFFDSSQEKMTSSEHITEIILGRWGTWSLGSNIISDIIIDLGVVLLPLLMLIIGAIGGYSYSVASRIGGTISITVYVFVTALYFEYPRYTVDFVVRGVVWLLLGIFLAKSIVMWNRFGRR